VPEAVKNFLAVGDPELVEIAGEPLGKGCIETPVLVGLQVWEDAGLPPIQVLDD
jgi:hypothetical protein